MSLSAVMIDNREPAHITNLKFGGIPAVVTTLETGDLWASCADGELLVVERKTVNDLLHSIKDGRLFNQAAKLRERSPWAYLVVTGALTHSLDGHIIVDRGNTQWRYDDVQGALLTIQELGVSLIHCRDDSEYEAAIIRLAKRERCKDKVIAPRSQGKLLTPGEQILTSLPGIGLERAQLLMNEFQGDTGHAISWLTWLDTFVEIAGIGNGTKAGVRRALGLAENEWLTVFSPEAVSYAVATGDMTVPIETEKVLA